jgi:hypothetical protein
MHIYADTFSSVSLTVFKAIKIERTCKNIKLTFPGMSKIMAWCIYEERHSVALLVEALCYKLEGRGFDSQ